MGETLSDESARSVPWWQPIVFAAMAGGMGWGIRGQYGHETGAMIAGLLVTLTLTFLLCPGIKSFPLARAAAFGTIAMGFGGSMTYGQTLGLTQNGDMIGNWDALRWGLLGCLIKGGIWIGFAGVFFGMGLSGVRYKPGHIFALMLAALGAYYIGIRLFNYPYDPAHQELPRIYFSASWHWQPDAVDLKPRREEWGGLLLALIAVTVYASRWRGDRLARNMALWGFLGGAMGFPLGQCIQAFHAWNPAVFDRGIWMNLDQYMNWWNMMEITFGTVMGGTLGLGLWLNRRRIHPANVEEEYRLGVPVEFLLLAVHLTLLVCVAFLSIAQVDALYDLGLIMGIIPLTALAGARWWPYLVLFPITLVPIAGKTLRQLGYNEEAIAVTPGWIMYVFIPLTLSLAMAIYLGRKPGASGNRLAKTALLFNAWMFFGLNFAFFRFPWPWADWTGRTPSGLIYMVCITGLTALALTNGFGRIRPSTTPD
jgi:hypothetical protein